MSSTNDISPANFHSPAVRSQRVAMSDNSKPYLQSCVTRQGPGDYGDTTCEGIIYGRFHLTHPKAPRSLADNDEISKQGAMLRAALYSGGRFANIVIISCISDDAAVYNDTTDEILPPRRGPENVLSNTDGRATPYHRTSGSQCH